jgi:hypothetical protein
MPPGVMTDCEDGGADGRAAEVAWLMAGKHGDGQPAEDADTGGARIDPLIMLAASSTSQVRQVDGPPKSLDRGAAGLLPRVASVGGAGTVRPWWS